MKENYVYYEDFGAVGDGVTDDFDAIVACHEYANRHGIAVRAKDTAIYYIGGKAQHAVIKTDVDFGKAKFIIDDRQAEDREEQVFVIESDFDSFPIRLSALKRTDKQVDFPHEGRVMVNVENDGQRIFIREGLNQNNGAPQHEVFIVDENGNIETTLNWDYEKISSATAKRVDDEPIIVKGGVFTTIANQAPAFYTYYFRGIKVSRSNVTVCDMEHYVEGEGDTGAPYYYFIGVYDAYNVTLKNLLLTPRFTYKTPSSVPGKEVSMGSYDLAGGNSVKISLISIRQTRDIMDRRYWGLIGTNYCKEFYIDGCVMSRFDAHQGATDVTIKNSAFGHQSLNLIGHGSFLIENSTVFGRSFINLRRDYGCHWDGTVTVRGCTWKPDSSGELTVIAASNPGQHYFGYDAKMPHRIEIDSLLISDGEFGGATRVFLLPAFAPTPQKDSPYPYAPVNELSLGCVKTESGCAVEIAKFPELYENLIVK